MERKNIPSEQHPIQLHQLFLHHVQVMPHKTESYQMILHGTVVWNLLHLLQYQFYHLITIFLLLWSCMSTMTWPVVTAHLRSILKCKFFISFYINHIFFMSLTTALTSTNGWEIISFNMEVRLCLIALWRGLYPYLSFNSTFPPHCIIARFTFSLSSSLCSVYLKSLYP